MDIATVLGIQGVAAAAATYMVVFTLKKTPLINNKWLPLASLIIGVVIGLIFGYFDPASFKESILFGMAVGSGAVTADQFYKNIIQPIFKK